MPFIQHCEDQSYLFDRPLGDWATGVNALDSEARLFGAWRLSHIFRNGYVQGWFAKRHC